jgi:predicted NBD/HSP70 family sugar kinase
LSTVLGESEIPLERIEAVSVGTPGVVDPATSRVSLAPQIEGWEGVDIVAAMRDVLPCRVIVDSEVQLSVLAERWTGAGKGIDDVVYINVGIGIAAGILLNGVRLRGAHGAAGEIGYMPVGTRQDNVGLGYLGALEQAAGGGAYAALGAAAAREPGGATILKLAGGAPDDVDAEVVFQAAALGDRAANSIIDELVGRLARGVAAVAAVVDPSVVIIGGGVSRAGEPLLARLRSGVGSYLPRPPRLLLSTLGEEAVAIGAVLAGIEDWEDRAFAHELLGS